MPGPTTPWTVESGTTLSETTPVTLAWDNGNGLIFRRTISVDANYMFTMVQSVENRTGAEVRLAPYGIIARHGTPTDLKNFYILHEGAIAVADGELHETKYKAIRDFAPNPAEGGALAEIDRRQGERLDRLHRPLLDDDAGAAGGPALHRGDQVHARDRHLPDRHARCR